MSKKSEQNNPQPFSEEEKDELRKRGNAHISQLCNYAALLIIIITFASFILGQSDLFYSQVGIMASIALLAIAAINHPKRKQ